MTVATVARTEPARHGLVIPECECGTCAPTWARRRGKSKRFSEPVTLVDALQAADAAHRPGMVEQHRQCLSSMTHAVDELLAATPWDDLGRPEVGLSLLLFAAELASALRPDQFRDQLPAEQIADCEQTVTAATLAAAACMTGLIAAVQILADLVG